MRLSCSFDETALSLLCNKWPANKQANRKQQQTALTYADESNRTGMPSLSAEPYLELGWVD